MSERGWGRKNETWNAKEELAAYGVEPTWFGLGDRDLATHLVRTQMLDAGFPLSQVTAGAVPALGTPGPTPVALLPMSDDRIETHVQIVDPEDGEPKAVHFQEYWIKHRAAVPATAVVPIGIERSTPAPGVLEAISGGRPGDRAAVEPGRLDRHHPRRARASRTRSSTARLRSSGSAASSAATTCTAWPGSCSR